VYILWQRFFVADNAAIMANNGAMMEKFILISTGAVLGANLRYWVGDWAAQKWGSAFPYGTLLINVTGSLLLGFLMTLIAESLALDPRWRLFFGVGFLGAYTTFSTYMFESFSLIDTGQLLPGLGNLLGSTLLGILAVGAGIFLARMAGMQVEWLARVLNVG
jgi:CrcB protein